MIRLIMIPAVMAAGALLAVWVEGKLPEWERNREIGWLIKKNRKWERMIEETPRKRMAGTYAKTAR